jgi:hypothetical protein
MTKQTHDKCFLVFKILICVLLMAVSYIAFREEDYMHSLVLFILGGAQWFLWGENIRRDEDDNENY